LTFLINVIKEKGREKREKTAMAFLASFNSRAMNKERMSGGGGEMRTPFP
jgi:hypothetical protein